MQYRHMSVDYIFIIYYFSLPIYFLVHVFTLVLHNVFTHLLLIYPLF